MGRSAAIAQVAVPKAQMVPKQDWTYVAGARHNLQGAHERDAEVSCLRFSADNATLLSRCGDDTLKVHRCTPLLGLVCNPSQQRLG